MSAPLSAQRRANERDRDGEIALHERSREPEHANAERASELRIAHRIERGDPIVTSAIDLDDEPIRRTVEVDDEPDRERMLTTETWTEPTIAQGGPEQRFAASGMLAMKSSKVNERKQRRGVVR